MIWCGDIQPVLTSVLGAFGASKTRTHYDQIMGDDIVWTWESSLLYSGVSNGGTITGNAGLLASAQYRRLMWSYRANQVKFWCNDTLKYTDITNVPIGRLPIVLMTNPDTVGFRAQYIYGRQYTDSLPAFVINLYSNDQGIPGAYFGGAGILAITVGAWYIFGRRKIPTK